jgi:hypothetical protein
MVVFKPTGRVPWSRFECEIRRWRLGCRIARGCVLRAGRRPDRPSVVNCHLAMALAVERMRADAEVVTRLRLRALLVRCFLSALVLPVAVAAVSTGCGPALADPNTATNRPLMPRLMLGEGLHFFDKGKTLYWIGPSFEGYEMRAVDTFAGDPNEPGSPGPHSATVEYILPQERTLEVVTYVLARPRSPMDYPPLVRVHSATGQLVAIEAPSFYQASNADPLTRPEIARLVKALRPVTQADVDAMPEMWSEIPG